MEENNKDSKKEKSFEDIAKELDELLEIVPDITGKIEEENTGENSKEFKMFDNEEDKKEENKDEKNVEDFEILTPDDLISSEPQKKDNLEKDKSEVEIEEPSLNAENPLNNDEKESSLEISEDTVEIENKEENNINTDSLEVNSKSIDLDFATVESESENKEKNEESKVEEYQLSSDTEDKIDMDIELDVSSEEKKTEDGSNKSEDVQMELNVISDIKEEAFSGDSSFSGEKGYSDELKNLIEKKREDIPSERVKKVGFVFNFDEELFKNVLETLDEITQASEDKPMFIERSFVLNYSDDFNSNFLLEMCKNEGVKAVMFVGELPVNQSYDINNVLSEAGIMFFHINKDNFSRTRLIDFVMELIIL